MVLDTREGACIEGYYYKGTCSGRRLPVSLRSWGVLDGHVCLQAVYGPFHAVHTLLAGLLHAHTNHVSRVTCLWVYGPFYNPRQRISGGKHCILLGLCGPIVQYIPDLVVSTATGW